MSAMKIPVPKCVECFYPGDSFPAISVTGRGCALNCKHCSRKYLEGMIPAKTPDDLLGIAEALAQRGALGFLLSGGSDSTGKVDLTPFVPAIKEIKSTTNLRINAHVGLTQTEELRQLVSSGIDSFSIDLYGDDSTIREVLGLDAKADDYFRVFEELRKLGAGTVAPHICVGIHGGELKGEMRIIDRLRKLEPRTLIIISLIPTKGSVYEKVTVPSGNLICSVVEKARKELPATKLVLGCMRSKLDRTSEFAMVRAGLDGIVLPGATTVDRLRADGYTIERRETCCSLI
jgi:uncharacterized radical SAM superfamily protein